MRNKINLYVDNTIFTFQKAGGVSVYWYELLRRYAQNKHQFRVNIIKLADKSINIFDRNLDYSLFNVYQENFLIPKLHRYFPVNEKLESKSIYHSSYFRTSYRKDIVNIITVYDFAHDLGFSSGFPRKYANIWQKKQGIFNADGIICISESTKIDLLKLYPQIDENKVIVIHLAVSDEFRVLETRLYIESITKSKLVNVQKPYIVYIGERATYKNFKVAVETLRLLEDYNLVIVGGGELNAVEQQYIEQLLPNRFLHLKNIHSAKLNEVFNEAFCLIYPSRYEGFGIPLIEAMKAGCPVITTSYASIPEVVGQAGLIVKEILPNLFVEKVKYLEFKENREKIVEMGLIQASLFSWDRCYEETIKFYQKIYNTKFC